MRTVGGVLVCRFFKRKSARTAARAMTTDVQIKSAVSTYCAVSTSPIPVLGPAPAIALTSTSTVLWVVLPVASVIVTVVLKCPVPVGVQTRSASAVEGAEHPVGRPVQA